MDRLIQNVNDLTQLYKFLDTQKLPFTISVVHGKARTLRQNKLQRMWCNEISEQQGDTTPEEIRGYCKLAIGVPILRATNERFQEAYDRVIRPHSYEDKIAMMMEPLDFPVTRLMTSKQKTQYLDDIYVYWSERGIVLTSPEGP